jgi:pyruvate formate lyase activating enzyme
VLSFGTAGCNLACRFCQNWDISKSKEMDTLADAASPGGHRGRRRAPRLPQRGVHLQRPHDLPRVRVRRGRRLPRGGRAGHRGDGRLHLPEPRRDFYAHLDALNVDLKGFTEEFYKRVCAGHLAPVLETLEYLRHETEAWFEITTLLIPGHNDGDAELDELTSWVAEHLGPDVPLHFTAFHPDFKMTDLPRTPPATLTRARAWGAAQRPPPRLHRQRARPRRVEHLVPGVRGPADRARLVRAGRVGPNRRRPLPVVRPAARRALRRTARLVGPAVACPCGWRVEAT